MHRFSVRRLSAWIVAVGACIALSGGSVLLSAQGAQSKSPWASKARRLSRALPTRGKWAGGTKPGQMRPKGAPQVMVSGEINDGSGAGWPLYASLLFTSESTTPVFTFTDPVTGAYSINLFDGIEYTLEIDAVGDGYLPLEDTITTAGSDIEYDAVLLADGFICEAPGYASGKSMVFFSESFDGGTLPAGWEITNDSKDGEPWIIFDDADPCGQFAGNETGGSGPFALVNSNCDGFVTDDTSLITPSIDMTGVTNPFVRFANDYITCCGQTGDVDYSIDGGSSWINALFLADEDLPGPSNLSAGLPQAANQPDVRIRWHFNGFFSWWWQVDDIEVGDASCVAQEGGLIVGNVFDLNTDAGLAGATVAFAPTAGLDTSTTTFDVPEDPNQPGGFYILFSPNALQPLDASLERYGTDMQTAAVVPGDTVRQDFHLPSASLDASPRPVNAIVDPGGATDGTLTLTNSGQVDATFSLFELNTPPSVPPSALGRFADAGKVAAALARIPNKWRWDATGRFGVAGLPAIPGAPEPPAVPLAAGAVISSFPTGLGNPFGVIYNTAADNVWISSLPAPLAGDGRDHEFLTDGTATGNTVDMTVLGAGVFPTGGALNARTGMLWQAATDFSLDPGCVYEIDPVANALTGNSLCPNIAVGQTALAYDAVSDTYFASSFVDGVITRFDSSGQIVESAFTGLAISGLAYNPSTHHLFAANQNGPDVWVLDPATDYSLVGLFSVGAPGIPPGNLGGLGIDCDGHLWVVDQGGTVFEVESGESGVCSILDIPWLSEDPTTGTVLAAAAGNGGANPFPITLSFDSAGLRSGLHSGLLVFTTDTPNPVDPVAVNLTVRFNDVPDSNQFAAYIYGAAGAGIMTGCGGFDFCPDGVVTRADMAGYIGRAVNGADFLGVPYTNSFDDVTQQTSNANYIQWLVDQGITAGCGTDIYCPDQPNTRAQMAVFITKAVEGSSFVPPACTGVFTDVACPGGFAVDYIEYIYNQGVTAGCGGGNYCPNANISNGQMAVFLVKAFNVPHL